MKRALLLIAAGFLALTLVTLGGLKTLVWFGEQVPMIEEVGPEVVAGAHRTTPIRFAQTDFWFYPPVIDAENGRLTVPARRSHPDGPKVDIQYVRFPATGGEPGGPPIVYLAGGPGGSGIDTASGDRFPFFMALREAGDVIALDQRGTFLPSPQCPARWVYPDGVSVDAVVMATAHEPILRECFAHFANSESAIHPDSYTAVESAADLEDLRIALGVEQLSFVGISYGTHLAQAYIRNYPGRAARAVLAGVEGPDHTYKRPAVVDSVLRDIDQYLAEEEGWIGLVADLEAARDRLDRERPSVAVEHPWTGEAMEIALGPLDILRAAHFGLGEREDFLKAAGRIRAIAQGDNQMLARYVALGRGRAGPHLMPISMDCASGISDERRAQIAQEMAGSILGQVINLDLTTYCPYWPVTDLGDEFRSNLMSDVPVLAVSGTLDMRTPPSNADEALAGFSDYAHLIIENAAHGDDLLIGSPEIAEAMARFLATGEAGRERISLTGL
jgi:pimeloyl-ACP methyl ester carboxylesterase